MRKAAEEHAAEDEERRKEIETINQADAAVYSTERLLEELKDKVEGKTLDKVKEANEKLKKLLEPEKKDHAAIGHELDALNKLVQAATTELYQKAGAAQAASQANGEEGAQHEHQGDEKVVDAEFSEKESDETKKKGKK